MSANSPPTEPVARRAAAAWGWAAWALGLAVGFWPLLVQGELLGDAGDARFVGYLLEHGFRALTGEVELLHPNFFFPVRGVGAWSELMLPLVPLYAPWRLVGLAPDTSAQLWLLCVASLNALCAWRLLRGVLGVDAFPAAVGTFLIAFGSPRLAQLHHQHLVGVFLALLVLEGLGRWLSPLTARPGPWLLAAGVAFAAQVGAGLYVGFFLALGLGAALGFLTAHAEGRALLGAATRRSPAWLGATALVTLALLFPLVRVYLGAGGAHDWGVVKGYVPELHSWLNVGPEHWLWGWTWGAFDVLRALPSEGEHRLGPGVVTLGLVGWSLWQARRTLAGRVLGLTVVTLFLLALRWRGGWSPWWLVYHFVPGGSGLRVVARLGVVLLVPFGVAVAWGLSRLRRRWLAFALGAVVVAEQLRTPWHASRDEARAAVARIKVPAGCRAFAFDAPGTEAWPFEHVQLDAMWAALEQGVPTVNGYTGRAPEGWSPDVLRDPTPWEVRHGLEPGFVCVVRGEAR